MITIVKLANGIEVIGEAVTSNSSYVVLERPLQINYRYFVSTTPSVSFVKYILFAETDSVTFDRMHILNEVKPREAFERFYLHSVQHYYADLGKMIDDELTGLMEQRSQTTMDDHMKHILETMSVEGAPIN